ncbi:MAG: class I SAM-dependent methyltransferase [Steroidobacteraceae bacterium]
MSEQSVYTVNAIEQARQDFILGLKYLANGSAQQKVREAYQSRVAPQLTTMRGVTPSRRDDVQSALEQTPEFRRWAVLTHHSQTMMWDAIEATTQRVAADARQRFAAAPAVGSLHLDPTLTIPTPISDTEIHRQPGGYVGAIDKDDLTPGLRYIGASLIYGVGKGQRHATGDGRANLLLNELKQRFPDLRPRRILDLGCGIGVHSQAIARAYPEAQYVAVDVAAGLLRFGHLIAAERGIPIEFRQADAAATGLDSGSFDLVVSNIFFHETNATHLPAILRECRRVLAPGGAMLHVDVATQVTRLGLDDQVMNDWQVRWNGEPFWTGFAETDMLKAMQQADFPAEHCFADYARRPGGATYVFGASLPNP